MKDVVIKVGGREIEAVAIVEHRFKDCDIEGVSSRVEMINYMKHLGIELFFGSGDLPISYSIPLEVSKSEALVGYITRIKRSEWLN